MSDFEQQGSQERSIKENSRHQTEMKTIILVVLQVGVLGAGTAQVEPASKGDHMIDTYSNANIGFRYKPPIGMQDETVSFRSQIEAEEKASGATAGHAALVEMSSGEDGGDPNWRLLTIETYPRNAISDPDDISAEAKISAWLAHSEDASPSSNKSAVVSGQRFSISVFALQDGPIRKGAVVWTTIRKGRLLSFFFAANSPDRLKVLAETMKSVELF